MTGVNQGLYEALLAVDRHGNFCGSGQVPAVVAPLYADGVGLLGLPLSAAACEALYEHGEPAPYGRGAPDLVGPVTMAAAGRLRGASHDGAHRGG